MIPSMENLFKRGADLYYSRRHSYPLFTLEIRPGMRGEWIYEVTIKGNNGRVAQCRFIEFKDNTIVSMIESLLLAEDVASGEYEDRLDRDLREFETMREQAYTNIFQREYDGEIRATGDRVHIEPAGINAISESVQERPALCIGGSLIW